MDENTCLRLLEMVTPTIEKKDSIMRNSISSPERLSVTLTFLATDRCYDDLEFSTPAYDYWSALCRRPDYVYTRTGLPYGVNIKKMSPAQVHFSGSP